MSRSRAVLGVFVAASLCLAACGKSKSDGCSKDTDCKNDRVCNDGACVESSPPPSAAPAKSRKEQMFGGSKEDIAGTTVKKYAFEAYPSWSVANPDKACPDRLDDLNEYMNNKDVKDPWGTPYRMLCGSSLPPGARGLAVVSAGPDGKEATSDDLRSWD